MIAPHPIRPTGMADDRAVPRVEAGAAIGPVRQALHLPTEEDRRAVHRAAALRRARSPEPPCWAEDEALALAAADPRNNPAARALSWLVWAYNRSPPRAMLDATDWPPLILEGILPPIGRWLSFAALPEDRASAYRRAARTAPLRTSGWPGCLVVLPVWAGLSALVIGAIVLSTG